MYCRSICRLVELSELRPMLEQSRLYGIARPKSFKRQVSNDNPFGVAQCLSPIRVRAATRLQGSADYDGMPGVSIGRRSSARRLSNGAAQLAARTCSPGALTCAKLGCFVLGSSCTEWVYYLRLAPHFGAGLFS